MKRLKREKVLIANNKLDSGQNNQASELSQVLRKHTDIVLQSDHPTLIFTASPPRNNNSNASHVQFQSLI